MVPSCCLSKTSELHLKGFFLQMIENSGKYSGAKEYCEKPFNFNPKNEK